MASRASVCVVFLALATAVGCGNGASSSADSNAPVVRSDVVGVGGGGGGDVADAAVDPPDAESDASPEASDASADVTDGGPPDAPLGDLLVAPAMFVAPMVPLVLVVEGADIPLSLPPQGGHVLFAGAQIQNVATDTVKIRGRLRDPDTDAIVAEEARTVTVRPVPGADGLWETNPDSYSQHANIAACPDYSPRAIDGASYVLEVTVTELYVAVPRTATARVHVVPRCPTDGADAPLCSCECAADYVLGKCPPSGLHGG